MNAVIKCSLCNGRMYNKNQSLICSVCGREVKYGGYDHEKAGKEITEIIAGGSSASKDSQEPFKTIQAE